MVDYNSRILGTQHATIYNVSEFKNEVAACRTFVFLHELELLLNITLLKEAILTMLLYWWTGKFQRKQWNTWPKYLTKKAAK